MGCAFGDLILERREEEVDTLRRNPHLQHRLHQSCGMAVQGVMMQVVVVWEQQQAGGGDADADVGVAVSGTVVLLMLMWE